jgi:hypothetical protein
MRGSIVRIALGIVRHPLGIVAALRMLDDTLRRMQAHQSKKASGLRPLSLAHRLTGYPSRHLEPHPGLLQVRRLKPFGEPAVDLGQQLPGLGPLALLMPQPT